MSSEPINEDQRQAFFYLQEIMETVLVIENQNKSSYQINKLVEKRQQLQSLLQTAPSFGIEYLQDIWQRCFFLAKEQVEKEHFIRIEQEDLSWQQIFDTEY